MANTGLTPSDRPNVPSAGKSRESKDNGAGDSDVAKHRREQVIEAAITIIAQQGLHRLSLTEIEKRTGMARGHLTYYFPYKEDILIAVFDRMLDRMIENAFESDGPRPGAGRPWECMHFMFNRHINGHTDEQKAFSSLLHTFLAQINYRADYRRKLAERHEEWRSNIAQDLEGQLADPDFDPRAMASIIIAIIQGLSQQVSVEPKSFDKDSMKIALTKLFRPVFAEHAIRLENERGLPI